MDNRREFLKKMAWGGAAMAAAGCVVPESLKIGRSGAMSAFTVPPMDRIRVGVIGVGGRGLDTCRRVQMFEGVSVTAVCDVRPAAAEGAKKMIVEMGQKDPVRMYAGSFESFKGLCDDPDVDVVYTTVPQGFHAEHILYALRAGKHVFSEVPGCETVDQAWEIVETAEKVRRHAMMLENSAYGEPEMLAFTMCHDGMMGTLVHADCGYLHNLIWRQLEDSYRNRWHHKNLGMRTGDRYPTHGLGPVCQWMDVNRGDRLEYLMSIQSLAAAYREYAAEIYPKDAWQNKLDVRRGDMVSTLIHTAMGRTISMQYSLVLPRPYSRKMLIQGTRGMFAQFPRPWRMCFAKTPGDTAEPFLPPEEVEKVRQEHMNPLWRKMGEIARANGGHSGKDFLMDARWIYCLKNGLPLDQDVYDLASWSSVMSLTELSCLNRGKTLDIPDFTRGAWKTTKPLTIAHFDVDLDKTGLKPEARKVGGLRRG